MADVTTKPLLSPTGNIYEAAPEELPELSSQGYTTPTPEALAQYQNEQKYGSGIEQAKTFGEGAAQGATFGLSNAAETALGVNPEDIRNRRETNPGAHFAGELAGLTGSSLIPVVGEGNIIKGLGEGAASLAIPEAASTLAKVGKLGIENAVAGGLMSAGDEVSRYLENDPGQSTASVLTHVGLSSLLGGGVGGGLGVAGAGLSKLGGGAIEDFTNRIADHINGKVPTADDVAGELSNEYGKIQDMAEQLRGGEGLKAQDIQKLLPQELSNGMVDQASGVLDKARGLLEQFKAEPGIYQGGRAQAFQEYANRLQRTLMSEDPSPQAIFTAMDDFKKGVGSLKKWTPFSSEVEKPAANAIGGVYGDLKDALEDSSVWGKAAERQQAVNKLWTQHIPAMKDFQQAFTEKVGGEPQISPSKVQSALNGLGKPGNAGRIEKLSNWLDSNDKMYQQLDKIHQNLGVENPITPTSMTMTRALLGKPSLGMRLADQMIGESLPDAMGKVMGAAVGNATGLPGAGLIGALGGNKIFTPLIKTVLPGIWKAVAKAPASAAGFKGAVQYGLDAAAGEATMKSAVKDVFTSGSSKVVDSAPYAKVAKLDDRLKEVEQSPQTMLALSDHPAGHYMPEHTGLLATTTTNAVQYLNQLRPRTVQNAPLDTPRPPSKAQEIAFRETLQIAHNPLIVLNKLKQGTLTSKDIGDLANMYPQVHQKLQQTLVSEMTNHLSKEGTIPYKTKVGMSLFMGQPLDSTMNPHNIQIAQAIFADQQAPQPSGPKNGTKKNTSKLGELASLDQTAGQAREKDKLST